MSVISILGDLAAIAAAMVALILLRPKLRDRREAFVARVFAWRWASPRGYRLLIRQASRTDRVVELVLCKIGHVLVPRRWKMTSDEERVWGESFDAAIREHARRDEARRRHRAQKRDRRAICRKRCASCGERCDAMGTLREDGSAECGECRLPTSGSREWTAVEELRD